MPSYAQNFILVIIWWIDDYFLAIFITASAVSRQRRADFSRGIISRVAFFTGFIFILRAWVAHLAMSASRRPPDYFRFLHDSFMALGFIHALYRHYRRRRLFIATHTRCLPRVPRPLTSKLSELLIIWEDIQSTKRRPHGVVTALSPRFQSFRRSRFRYLLRRGGGVSLTCFHTYWLSWLLYHNLLMVTSSVTTILLAYFSCFHATAIYFSALEIQPNYRYW